MKAQEKVPKENAGKTLLLHTHTTTKLIKMTPSLSPQHKLLGPAVQHGVNSYSDQNLEALPAPFTFLGLQVNKHIDSGE